MHLPPLLVTIDGPAGAGKTTVSRMLAQRLGYRYVDTGALYRAVALAALEAGVAADDDDALDRLCRRLTLELRDVPQGEGRLFLNGADVTDQLRTRPVTAMASAVSARAPVRRFLLDLQRRLGERKQAVFEGRDMGTVVFPEAEVKFFLDASLAERARRRHAEMNPADRPPLETVAAEIQRRDRSDSQRDLAPLRPAAGAVPIDATAQSPEGVVAVMLAHIAARAAGPSPPAGS
jgi:cytidylate kinase